MLKLKHLCENFDLARLALTHWPHDPAATEKLLPHFRISANAVYPFETAGRRCFLRLTPAEEQQESHLRAELAFLDHLQRQGFPALRPIPADAEKTLLLLDTPWGPWYACAFTGVPGRPVEDLPMTADLAVACGETLGQLHRIARDWQPPADCRSHRTVLAWIASGLTAHAAPPALLDAVGAVARQLDALPQDPGTYGFIHYDFEPDNVFHDGIGCHVIDFGDCMQHFYALDLVQALDELDSAWHAAFREGYARLCPLPDESLFPPLRRFRDLYSCARLLHCLSEKPDPMPDWAHGVVARLEWRLQQLTQDLLH